MSGLIIDQTACTGCGLCVRACPSGALKVENKKAMCEQAKCTFCSLCREACPKNCITVDFGGAGGEDAGAFRGVWVFAELRGDELVPVVLELLTRGRTLANELHEPLCAVLLGGGAEAEARLLRQRADTVYSCRLPAGTWLDDETCLAPLAALVNQYRPAVFLFGATPFGRSLAPRLAARLKTGLTADCTRLEIDPETKLLCQTRPAFGGNLMATILCPDHRPQMATVRPGVMPQAAPAARFSGTVVPFTAPAAQARRIELLDSVASGGGSGLRDADILVDVGRGIGVRKNLKLAQRLAELLGAQLCCSRPLVEAGWLPYSHQVGQTGVTVAPKLIFTFGISGAIQHQAGISGAERIVAVNSDPDAPIFALASHAVVGDCVEVLQAMIALLEG